MAPTKLRLAQLAGLVTSGFGGILSATEDTIQKAFDKLDDHTHPTSYSAFIGGNALANSVAAGATQYVTPFCSGFTGTTIRTNFPHAGTACNLWVRIDTAQPAGGALTVTLMLGGNPSAVVVTIPGGTAAGRYGDQINTAAVSSGQGINFRIVNSNAAASALINGITLEIADLT
jgi:hypothetical protein